MSINQIIHSPFAKVPQTKSAETAREMIDFMKIVQTAKSLDAASPIIKLKERVSDLLVGGHADLVKTEVEKTLTIFQEIFNKTPWYQFSLSYRVHQELKVLREFHEVVVKQVEKKSTVEGLEASIKEATETQVKIKDKAMKAQAKRGVEECRTLLCEIQKIQPLKLHIDWQQLSNPAEKAKLISQQHTLSQMKPERIYEKLLGAFVFFTMKLSEPKKHENEYLAIDPENGLFTLGSKKLGLKEVEIKRYSVITEDAIQRLSVSQLSDLHDMILKTVRVARTAANEGGFLNIEKTYTNAHEAFKIQSVIISTLARKRLKQRKTEKNKESERQAEILKKELSVICDRLQGKKTSSLVIKGVLNAPNVKADKSHIENKINALLLPSHAESVKDEIEKTKVVFQKAYDETSFWAYRKRSYLKTQLRALEELATAAETQQHKCQAAS